MNYKKYLEQFKKIEKEMDKVNADYGSKDCLYIYCKSKEYNGKEGIVHAFNCPITYTRHNIKQLKEKLK